MLRSWRSCFYRFKLKYFLIGIIFLYLLNFFGVFTHIFELDFDKSFSYPLDGDVLRYAHQIRYNEDEREVNPINKYFTYLKKCENKCFEDGHTITPKLVFIVKSAMKNFNKRLAIRKTWGYEKRFSNVVIRTVFIIGVGDNQELQKFIDIESEKYQDIVQAKFLDTYFNLTIKTMTGFEWAVKYCPRGQFFMFVDDDYYVSTKNVLKFIKYPTKYPKYFEVAEFVINGKTKNHKPSHNNLIKNLNLTDYEFPELLFSGFLFKSSPHRHKSSKWYVSLEEYPYHLWPPYVTGGAFVLSREALVEMYFVSLYTKYFRFEDIYLGIVALKSYIQPLHNDEFYFYKAIYRGPPSYRYVIASHGYDNSEELNKVWSEVRAAGYA